MDAVGGDLQCAVIAVAVRNILLLENGDDSPAILLVEIGEQVFQSGCRLQRIAPTMRAIMAAVATMKTSFCWLPSRSKASRRRSSGFPAGAFPAVVSVVAAINSRSNCGETEEESIEKPNYPRNILLLPGLNSPFLFRCCRTDQSLDTRHRHQDRRIATGICHVQSGFGRADPGL